MTVEAPPRVSQRTRRIKPASARVDRAELEALVEALIEEARQRARRRRRRNGTVVALVVLAVVALLSLVGRTSPAALEAQGAASAPAAVSGRPSGTIALTGIEHGVFHVYLWTSRGVRDSGIRGRAFGWSPDGSRLLVQRGSALYAVRVDGDGEALLTKHGDGFNAAWSPDGSRIALEGGPIPGRPFWRRILVAGTDGRGTRVLPGWAVSGGFFSGNLTWSPDGKDVVFSGRTASDSRIWLYRVAADGRTPPRPIAIDAPVTNPAQPTWSPDGSKLAFSDAGALTVGSLFVMNADGSHVRRFADGTGAVWSPDGSMLSFRSHGRGGTWTIHADGTHPTRLPPGSWYGLSWSPDSRYIAYAGGASHASNGDAFVIRPDGAGLVRILHRPGGAYGLPLWQHGTATTETG